MNIKFTQVGALAFCVKLDWFYTTEYLLLVEIIHSMGICWAARRFSMTVGSKLHQCTQVLYQAILRLYTVAVISLPLFRVYDCVTAK